MYKGVPDNGLQEGLFLGFPILPGLFVDIGETGDFVSHEMVALEGKDGMN